MTVGTIIINAANLVNVGNTAFYTAPESLSQALLAWTQIYGFLLENDDDYFCTQLYIQSTSFTTDGYRNFVYSYPLPTDFQTLRLLQFQGQGSAAPSTYFPCYKSTLAEFGNNQNFPAYRELGKNLLIYDPIGYSIYCMWYYPSAISAVGGTFTVATDLTYPNNMIPDAMTYLLAGEIVRKQKEDPTLWIEKATDILNTMKKQQSRDQSRAISPLNTFNEGFDPWY